jgi:plastocyanin
MKRLAITQLAAGFGLCASLTAFGAGDEFRLVIENHRFAPERLEVPAGRKVRLVVENRDASAEEFESRTLSREKVIPGKSSATIAIGPLKPGEYPFVGEFNEKTAKGVIVAK